MPADPAALTLTAVAGAIARGELSAEAVTQACLDRAERLDPQLHCIVDMNADAALEAARQADRQRAAGQPCGVLHGVPLAHKDMFYRAGRGCGCGSRVKAGFVPQQTATVLHRLDAAGALDIGRLHMVEFALGTTGHNEHLGTPRNPWHTDYIPGGSSSGSAVAVSSGLVYASLGSDTGGSIRLPAACCGTVGLKPSYGRVSRHAIMPLSFSLDHVGILARSIADCALLLTVISGADAEDVTCSSHPPVDYRQTLNRPLDGVRVAVVEEDYAPEVDSEVYALMQQSLSQLQTAGATLVPMRLPSGFAQANPLCLLILGSESAALHAQDLQHQAQHYGQQTLKRLQPGLLYSATQYIQALKMRQVLLNEMLDSVFRKADVLHLPVLPFSVPTIAESDVAQRPEFADYVKRSGHFTRPANYLGLPALALPIGQTANGLPNAFQLIGKPFAEATLLQIGTAYEQVNGYGQQHPPCW